MPRMRIISQATYDAFDKPPQLDFKERKQAFDLPVSLIEQASTLRSESGKIGFIVQCAYFKQAKRFFLPEAYHDRDVVAAAKLLGLSQENFTPSTYAKVTRLRHQAMILDFYGFRTFDDKASIAVETEIATMARQHLKPRLIFERCTDL